MNAEIIERLEQSFVREDMAETTARVAQLAAEKAVEHFVNVKASGEGHSGASPRVRST
jgi:hypothetical protein